MPARLISLFLLAFSLLLTRQSAQANSIPITGDSTVSADCFCSFASGPMFFLSLQTPSGPSLIGFVTPGTLVNFQLQGPFCSSLQGCLNTSIVTLGSQSTVAMTGAAGLIFSGTFTAPTGPANSEVSVTFPVAMIGNIVAFQDLGNGQKGPELFALNFKGSGTMTLTICVDCNNSGTDDIVGASANFTGTATTVPEPSSLAMLGTGLAGIARLLWSRRTKLTLFR